MRATTMPCTRRLASCPLSSKHTVAQRAQRAAVEVGVGDLGGDRGADARPVDPARLLGWGQLAGQGVHRQGLLQLAHPLAQLGVAGGPARAQLREGGSVSLVDAEERGAEVLDVLRVLL